MVRLCHTYIYIYIWTGDTCHVLKNTRKKCFAVPASIIPAKLHYMALICYKLQPKSCKNRKNQTFYNMKKLELKYIDYSGY